MTSEEGAKKFHTNDDALLPRAGLSASTSFAGGWVVLLIR